MYIMLFVNVKSFCPYPNKYKRIYIEEIKIGEADGVTAGDSELFVPEEKTDQWKKDLSLQFGIDMEQLKLEILS